MALQDSYLSLLARRRAAPQESAYSVGVKRYGGTGRNNPTMGPVDPMGYAERDAQASTRRNAMLRRLKAMQSNRLMSSDFLGYGR